MTRPSPEIWISVLVGLSIPLMAFGRSALQGTLALAFLGALLIDRGALWRKLKPNFTSPFFMLVALMTIVWIPGLFVSPEPWHSFSTWARTPLLMLGAGLLWAFLAASDRRLSVCQRALLIGGIIAMALALISLYAVPELALLMKGKLADGNRIRPDVIFKAFASAAVCLIPLALWSGIKLANRWRWAGLAVAVMSVVVIFESGSRSALFGVGIMAVLFVVALSLTNRKWMPVGGIFIAAAIGGTLVYLLDSQGWRSENPNDYLPSWLVDSHRQQIWLFVIEKAKEAPWFGHGINAVNFLPGAGDFAKGITAELVPSHPHNWVLEVLAETGAMGLGLMVVVLAYLFFGELGRFLRTGSTDALVLMLIMAGFWGSSLFNFSIWSTWWLLALFVSFAIVRASPERGAQKSPTG